MDPLSFEPLLKRIRWGGRRLGTLLGKQLGPEPDYAESWEIADHGIDQSCVVGGPLQGVTLRQLVRFHGQDLLGRHAGVDQFPLLIKYLDAHDWLSLQVHPNDRQAVQFDPLERGKTEAWVIIEAAPGSQVCSGLKPGVTADDLRSALQHGRLESCLHTISVRSGDCLFVPAGTIHALGPGILLAEVQQQSNLTFRLHDWGRVDADGNSRPLHLEESLACTDFSRGPVNHVESVLIPTEQGAYEDLVSSSFFNLRRRVAGQPFQLISDNECCVLMVLAGSGKLLAGETCCLLSVGRTVLIPAACDLVQIVPQTSLTLLEVRLP